MYECVVVKGTCIVGGSKNKGEAMMVWCFPGVCSFNFPTFMSVKHLVGGCANSVLDIVWIALLCWLMQMLFMCLFVKHERRCMQLSCWFEWPQVTKW